MTPVDRETLETCADIWLAASVAAHDFIDPDFWIANRDAMVEQYLPESELSLATRDGVVVGFAAVRGDVLEALFVRPDFWGRGVGRELLAELFATRPRLRLSVYRKNARALSFYQKAGFIETTARLCPGTGEEEIEMVWRQGGNST